MAFPQTKIRNFSIIAHIDHGKSTLADRILEVTGAVTQRETRDQFLDKMDIERERGITIKAQNVRLRYTAKDGETYQLNLIDTPGHVDFNYEVSRSLSACEGAILVVDSTQGVEAQTLANVYLALDQGLEIIPFLNKVDLPSSDVEKTKSEIEQVIGIDCSEAVSGSGKTGVGVPEILERIVRDVPPPKGDPDGTLRALIFDTWYDSYRGAMVMVRVVDGTLRKGEKVRFLFQQDRLRGDRARKLPALCRLRRRDWPWRGRLLRRQHQERSRHQGRRHRHHHAPAVDRCPSRLQGREADGLRRDLPHR